MRCSTCGESVGAGEGRCPTCGSVVTRRPAPVAYRGIRQCSRCTYRGDPIPYFRKAGNIGLLVGISAFTYGVGGLVYYALRRTHEVCPSCGAGWEHAREPGTDLAEAPAPGDSPSTEPSSSAQPASPSLPASRPPKLPPSGVGRRIFGAGLATLATVLITAGIATSVFEPVIVGSVSGMAGSGLFLWGWKALQRRRQAVLQALNRKVLMLATEREGVLTVTEVAAELNLSLPAAEKIMNGMDDGLRVRSDVSKEGIIYYEFPEVRHRKALRSGGTLRPGDQG